MAKADSERIVRGKLVSLNPHSNAEWVDSYNSLLEDLRNGKYRDHPVLHKYGAQIAKNSLLQDLIAIGLKSLKHESSTVTLNIANLPQDLVNFLHTSTGQQMISNMIYQWYVSGMGLVSSTPLPSYAAHVPPNQSESYATPVENSPIESSRISFESTASPLTSNIQEPAKDQHADEQAAPNREHTSNVETKSDLKDSNDAISRALKLKQRSRLSV